MAGYPHAPDGVETFRKDWPLSWFLLKFNFTGQFLSLHDPWLSALCVIDVMMMLVFSVAGSLLLIPSLIFLAKWAFFWVTQHV